MKPRVFIGSSTERLEIAYAIQENLDHEADVTVWPQGIFKLSSTALDSLISSLDKFDFAIFVYHPDDVTLIRNSTVETVRDNLIFELGLFIGKMGKERVFILIPKNIERLHLPTDLLGITPGSYDNTRPDNNLLASLGPFCNQVRKILSEFIYVNIEGIQSEPNHIKKIVVERKLGWEQLFAAELLENRLIEINKGYRDIESGIVIRRLSNLNGQDFYHWFQNTVSNFENFLRLFTNCFNELNESFGPPGNAGNPIKIKNAVEKLIQLCQELLNWEYDLEAIKPPKELLEVKTILRGSTKEMFIVDLNKFVKENKEYMKNIVNYSGETIKFTLTIKLPLSFQLALKEFQDFFRRGY